LLVLCGHTQVACLVQLLNGKLVVNPVSVSLATYDHDDLMPRRMDFGSPQAGCTIVNKTARGWQIEHLAVSHNWHAIRVATTLLVWHFSHDR
jgi:hypothetical protein